MKPTDVSHKKWLRRAERWASVGPWYEATFTLAELVVTKAGIRVTDVVMTAVALRGGLVQVETRVESAWCLSALSA
jgi:hypothetical protein